MDAIVKLYTTSNGRIGRKTYWLAVLGAIAVSIVLSFILLPLLGSLGSLIVTAVLLYPAYCIGIKRRHDRDNNGMDYTILLGVSTLLSVVQALGIGMTPTDLGNGMVVMAPGMVMSIIQIIVGIYAIYMVVHLGFLKGTTGSNSYGPDPLAYAPAVA